MCCIAEPQGTPDEILSNSFPSVPFTVAVQGTMTTFNLTRVVVTSDLAKTPRENEAGQTERLKRQLILSQVI